MSKLCPPTSVVISLTIALPKIRVFLDIALTLQANTQNLTFFLHVRQRAVFFVTAVAHTNYKATYMSPRVTLFALSSIII
jgi:hypothetical protein